MTCTTIRISCKTNIYIYICSGNKIVHYTSNDLSLNVCYIIIKIEVSSNQACPRRAQLDG